MDQDDKTRLVLEPEDLRRLEKWAKENKIYMPNVIDYLSYYISWHLEELLDAMEEELIKPYE